MLVVVVVNNSGVYNGVSGDVVVVVKSRGKFDAGGDNGVDKV